MRGRGRVPPGCEPPYPAVLVTRPILGLCHMQVCVLNGTFDAEILREANAKNPAGTEQGWCEVVREGNPNDRPTQCEKFPTTRTHYLLVC